MVGRWCEVMIHMPCILQQCVFFNMDVLCVYLWHYFIPSLLNRNWLSCFAPCVCDPTWCRPKCNNPAMIETSPSTFCIICQLTVWSSDSAPPLHRVALPVSASRGLPSSPLAVQKSGVSGWTEEGKKGAVNGKKMEAKEAITERSIQLEPRRVRRLSS